LSQAPPNRQYHFRMTAEADLSLEVVVLLILGAFMLLFGLLLLKIQSGGLPYNPDSTYGLFLVLVSFQTITMGKTPFGDLRRSWALVVTGICTALIGMAACFIPGLLTEFIRILVGSILLLGGFALLLQLFGSKKKARFWMKSAGILLHLTLACGLVYSLTIISGLSSLFPGITTNPHTAVLLIVYGISFFYLSWCLFRIPGAYSLEKRTDWASNGPFPDMDAGVRFRFLRDASLPLSQAILILLGILLSFLGLLLFPVNLGKVAFSPDGQLGLLLTIMAIQMMALGDTPLGRYRRSWPMVIAGMAFAALGIVSCIVPGVLTGAIQVLIGVLNCIGGGASLLNKILSKVKEIRNPHRVPEVFPPILKKLSVMRTALDLVAIVFGLSMLIPGLAPGLVIAGILVINGMLLLGLVAILRQISAIATGTEEQESSPAQA
jgi:uncharacterized membrane protein HdeD (DUF308 family)